MAKQGGLVTLALHGPEHFAALGRRSRSAYLYGPTDAHKRLRMQDLVDRRKGLSDAEWSKRMAAREQSFGLAPGTLTSKLNRRPLRQKGARP